MSTKKFLDSSGLAHFWDKAKEYIGNNTIPKVDDSSGNLAQIDSSGNVVDSGVSKSSFALSEQGIPSGGSQNQVLAKAGSGNYNVSWKTPSYSDLDSSSKPKINGVSLDGNKDSSTLGLASKAQGEKADTVFSNYLKAGDSSGDSSVTGFDPFIDTVHNNAQSLSPAQQAQVRQNINAQQTITNVVAISTEDASANFSGGTLTLGLPKGADAVNPFKGWYDSSSNLPANPIVGDYAYVKSATTSDPAAIYECTTAGSWGNSGRTVDTSNVQTFASGEEVNLVPIDETKLCMPQQNALAKAEDVKDIALTEKVIEEIAFEDGKAITEDGSLIDATSSGANVKTYDITGAFGFSISGWQPSTAGRVLACLYTPTLNFVAAINSTSITGAIEDYFVLNQYPSAKFLKVFGNSTTPNGVKAVYKKDLSLNDIVDYGYVGDYKKAFSFKNLNNIIDARRVASLLYNTDGAIDTIVPFGEYELSDVNKYYCSTNAIPDIHLITSANPFTQGIKCRIDPTCNKIVFLGILATTTGSACYGFFDQNGVAIETHLYDIDSNLSSNETKEYVIDIPTGAYYFATNNVLLGTPPLLNQDNFYAYQVKTKVNIKDVINDVALMSENVFGTVNATEIVEQKCIKRNGDYAYASTPGAAVSRYLVSPLTQYYVSGYSPSDGNASDFVSILVKDTSDNVLLCYKPTNSAGFDNFELTIPATGRQLFVFGNNVKAASVRMKHLTSDDVKVDSIPRIFNNPSYRPLIGSKLKVLCFGSSWFMDTWWYLNHILGGLEVPCELHCYYIGHSRFEEWVQLYNNNLSPFSGSEATRNARKCVSVDGADWTSSIYSANGTYNAQSIRDDFFADLTAGDWDIIAFQQGAQQSIVAADWVAGHELVSIIKENCSPRTTIAFNATWTYGDNYPSGTGYYFQGMSRSEDGKLFMQQMNNRNTRLFMANTGLLDVSPNGAMMSLMRSDTTLNVSDDMASDGLHPSNGLPILGLCGCFYETFIAPLVGVAFKQSNWLPTSSTEKAPVSGSSFQACSNAQLSTIKSYIKKALANRFAYYKEE